MTDIDTDDDALDLDNLDEVDLDALNRCLEIAKRDRETRELMAEKPVTEAMETAVYLCQHSALNLKTWQEPPCVEDEDDPDPRDPDAQKLLRELLQAGISRFEPDPIAALQRVKRRRVKT
jgi:hypothetical protein